jgi:hypothetical protein
VDIETITRERKELPTFVGPWNSWEEMPRVLTLPDPPHRRRAVLGYVKDLANDPVELRRDKLRYPIRLLNLDLSIADKNLPGAQDKFEYVLTGIDFVQRALPVLRKVEALDLVIANAENAAALPLRADPDISVGGDGGNTSGSNAAANTAKDRLYQQLLFRSYDLARMPYLNAKKWAVAAVANFDFGMGPAKDIFESLQAYASMRSDFFKSIYNYRIAAASLEYATNEPLRSPEK